MCIVPSVPPSGLWTLRVVFALLTHVITHVLVQAGICTPVLRCCYANACLFACRLSCTLETSRCAHTVLLHGAN